MRFSSRSPRGTPGATWRVTRRRGVVVAALSALLLEGCAALPIVAVADWAAQAGGGALVKTGTEYTASGTARRTFTIPICDVHAATLEALRRAAIAVTKDEVASDGHMTIEGRAQHRTVRIRTVPLTDELTSMELAVKRNCLASDRATASELLAETERVLAEQPAFAARLDSPSTPPRGR